VPLTLGDEHSIALVEAHWLSFGKGETRSLEHIHDLLGVGVPVQQVHLSGGNSEESKMLLRVPVSSLLMTFLTIKPSWSTGVAEVV
jgi:hypothetical protein